MELDGLEGGREVTKDNLASWWSKKARSQQPSTDTSLYVSADTHAIKVDEGNQIDAFTKSVSEAAGKTAQVKEANEGGVGVSSGDREARIGMLREELTGLGRLKLGGDSIASLRPSASDMMNDFDLDGIRSDELHTIALKTRQVMARFLEGSARTSKEVAALLLAGAANKPSEDEEGECMVKIEKCINVVAQLVERRPKMSKGRVLPDGAVKKWEVKDVADIPERCRALVDTHRRMEVALCERIKVIETLIAELSLSKIKSTAKLDKNLVLLKDKYLKLEEKEKKEREKLESKLDADRKKQQQRDEKEKEKERKKAEDKPKEAKAKESKSESKGAAAKCDNKPETKPAHRGKKPEAVKNAGASSIMSFFGKPAGGAPPKVAARDHESMDENKCGTAGATQVILAPKVTARERRNFHPWEKPKNAVVACFPYGPGEITDKKKQSTVSACDSDLASWLAVLRTEAKPSVRSRAMREDGTAHPKMKLIQLNMKIPLVKTQLLDVDVEVEKKVWTRPKVLCLPLSFFLRCVFAFPRPRPVLHLI